ncbi:hypothetical protein JB92DRAFT_2811431 [Gautieria morchelliformis]|nr:hypothetical protein JB92DRAFT_2811431 [Gautieria morchelliformis]
MPSVISSVNELCTSVVSIFFDLFPSFLAVFNAILALGRDMVSAVVNLGQSVFKAAVGISGGVVELIWANIVGIAVCVGGYFLYTAYVQKRPTRGKRRA